MNKNQYFEAIISDVQKINPLFSKCTIRVMYKDGNRNGSYISQDSIIKAIPTIYNIPIVGEFIEKREDFGGHGGKIEITDEGINFIQTTKPYGVVPESAELYWEKVIENDGTTNVYLIAKGCYLWTGRYEEALSVIENGKGQSMEIEINNGSFAVKDGKKIFNIEDFTFSALCILGDGIEPCFESSSIVAYALDKDKFKQEFTQMLAELKFSLQSEDQDEGQKGGNSVPNEFENTEKEEFSSDDKMMDEDDKMNCSADEEEFASDPDEDQDDDSKESPDPEDEKKEFENENSSESESTVDFQAEMTSLQAELDSVKAELATAKENYTTLLSEVEELRTFKATKLADERNAQEAELFAKFSEQLSESEIDEVRSIASTLSIDEMATKLFALVGKKLATFSLKKEEKTAKMNVFEEHPTSKTSSKPYADVIQKYRR